MLNTIITVLMIAAREVLPLFFTTKYGKLFQLAYDAVLFVQSTMSDSATDSQKRDAALKKLKTTSVNAGIEASDHVLNKAIEFAVGKLKAKAA